MSEAKQENGLDRRTFLRTAAAVAAAAVATGTGAAILLEQKDSGSLSVEALLPQAATPFAPDAGSNLAMQLAQISAENARLRAQLMLAERRLQDANVGPTAAPLDLSANLQAANDEIGTLSAKVGALSGLVALYEQLDQVDLAAVAGGGLAAVSGVLGNLVSQLPFVSQGLDAGESALNELEEHLPSLEDGRRWLAGQLDLLDSAYWALATVLGDALAKTGTVLDLLQDWLSDLLRWLPFGLGRKAVSILESWSTILASLPGLIAGARVQVTGPFGYWLEPLEGEPRLRRQVMRPIQEQAIGPARGVVSMAQAVDSAVQGQLKLPVEEAIARRQALQQQIVAYRHTNQI
jgi:hypothetical protein